MCSTTKHLDFDLLAELKCPVCQEHMEPPITLCERGHNICRDCKQSSESCPTCSGTFLEAHNKALENIAKTAVYPCKNRESGCVEILSMNMKKPHQTECFYAMRQCPFATFLKMDCPWNGLLCDLKEHVLNEHGLETDTRQESGAFTISLKDTSAPKCYRTAVDKLGALFFVLLEIKDGKFFCAVVHIGPKIDSWKYKYRFTITTASEMEIISCCFVVQSFLTDMDKIFQPGECVILHHGTVTKFLDGRDALMCEMELYNVDSEPISILKKCTPTSGRLPTIVPKSIVDNASEEVVQS